VLDEPKSGVSIEHPTLLIIYNVKLYMHREYDINYLIPAHPVG